MVLHSQPLPAWLSSDAPQSDVVLSTRVRFMRNLAEHRFPNSAGRKELEEIEGSVLSALTSAFAGGEVYRRISQAEREYLLVCRLVSPDLEWNLPGRALWVDQAREIAVMVNEEDHVRLQALTPGWSITRADDLARDALEILGQSLNWAYSPGLGFLSASPTNVGAGRRHSAMLHLIGLGQMRRLPAVLEALRVKRLTARGLFGESSRAIGAFVQVSMVNGDRAEFNGAIEYLMTNEREARAAMGAELVRKKVSDAVTMIRAASSLSMADALRAIGWLRLAAGLGESPWTERKIDALFPQLEVRLHASEMSAAKHRSDVLRQVVEG
jgi:protein arginine kinase